MRLLIVISFFLFSINAYGQRIDDEDKVTGKYGTLMDGLKTIEKLNKIRSAGQGIKEGIAIGKAIKTDGIKGLKDRFSLKNLLLVYKNEKIDFIVTFNKASERLDSVITRVNDRVNMWRTTLPRLRAYKESIARMTDRSTSHLKDLSWKDITDIERTWDREAEVIVEDWKGLGQSIYNYSQSFGDDGLYNNRSSISRIAKLFSRERNNIAYKSKEELVAESMVDIELEVLANRKDENIPHYMTPQVILAQTIAAMQKTTEIAMEYGAPNKDKNGTIEDDLFKTIGKEVLDNSKMITDERELQAKIENIRLDIQAQRSSLQEILNLQYKNYIRIETYKQEQKVAASNETKDALAMFANEGVFRSKVKGMRSELYEKLDN